MDRFAGITAFVRVAESGGFTAAARQLNLSTTTVIERVQALENALGVRLLDRTTRSVGLTEIGRDYYERCVRILHELDEADQVAGALQATPRGWLRVYCHQLTGRFIAPVAADFLSDHPEVSLDLRTGDTMIDLVQEGFDLAVMPASTPRDTTLIRRVLAKTPAVLCCAPAYLEMHALPQSPADLADHKFLHYAYSVFGSEIHFADPAGNPVTARLSSTLVTTSLEVLRAAAVAGLGLLLISPYAVSDLVASGALIPLLPNYRKPELEVVALYPHRRHLVTKVRLFLDMLAERFPKELRRRGVVAER